MSSRRLLLSGRAPGRGSLTGFDADARARLRHQRHPFRARGLTSSSLASEPGRCPSSFRRASPGPPAFSGDHRRQRDDGYSLSSLFDVGSYGSLSAWGSPSRAVCYALWRRRVSSVLRKIPAGFLDKLFGRHYLSETKRNHSENVLCSCRLCFNCGPWRTTVLLCAANNARRGAIPWPLRGFESDSAGGGRVGGLIATSR
jgi:hypothetical protein